MREVDVLGLLRSLDAMLDIARDAAMTAQLPQCSDAQRRAADALLASVQQAHAEAEPFRVLLAQEARRDDR